MLCCTLSAETHTHTHTHAHTPAPAPKIKKKASLVNRQHYFLKHPVADTVCDVLAHCLLVVLHPPASVTTKIRTMT